MAGAEITEAEHEFVLQQGEGHGLDPRLAQARIRLDKTVVTEEEQVSADLRKERVEVESDVSPMTYAGRGDPASGAKSLRQGLAGSEIRRGPRREFSHSRELAVVLALWASSSGTTST